MFMAKTAYGNDQLIFLVGYSHSKPVKLVLKLKDNDFKYASIQYYGRKEKINLRFLSEEELRQNPNYPSLIQVEWEELYHGQKTGRYIMVFQGAVVYHFIYIRYSDMKVFFFDQDLDGW
jgi:hypothetical protein